tara:strand:- start:3014 stop:3685 length:672 start_codon:yes stop_codon:yes gene_type:complete
MPEPTYKGNASLWKQQRGTVFGTNENGLDYIELTFRGPSNTALNFRSQYTKGTACPEPGFAHCFLITAPEISEDSIGFSSTTLRFEGPHGATDESLQAVITHTTQEADLVVTTRKDGADEQSSYKYHRVVISVEYVRATRPSATKYDSEVNRHNTPELVADGKVMKGMKNYIRANKIKNRLYERGEWHTILSYTEEATGVFKVTEEHTVFLKVIEDSESDWKN